MATASSERGLNLRAPGRFLAAANQLVNLYKQLVREKKEYLQNYLIIIEVIPQPKPIDGKSFQSIVSYAWGDYGRRSKLCEKFLVRVRR